MTSPSWVELAGRNAAAEAVCVSATMRCSGGDGDDALDERFDFWHSPGGLWRIERAGEVVFMSTAAGESMVRIDGEMRRHRADLSVVWLGPAFSPLDLLGLGSLLRRMEVGMSASTPVRAEVGGRLAWAVTLSFRDDQTIDMVFDHATGLLVQMSSASESGQLEVSDLIEHDRLDDELFTWSGPVLDPEED